MTWIISGLVGIVIALAGYLGRRQINTIDELVRRMREVELRLERQIEQQQHQEREVELREKRLVEQQRGIQRQLNALFTAIESLKNDCRD